MAAPSVTNTFVNGASNDATEVNTNFSDVINGITDGTKDLTISALTCNGAVTLKGATTLGDADADAITIAGTATVTRTDLVKTSAPTANSLYPNALIKGWALLTVGAAGSVTVTSGFNVDTATWATSDLTVNFHTNMDDANYCVVGTLSVSDNNRGVVYIPQASKAVGSCVLQIRRDNGATQNWVATDVVQLIVLGGQ